MGRVGRVLDDWRLELRPGENLRFERNCDNVAEGIAGQKVVREEIWEGEGREPEGRDSGDNLSGRGTERCVQRSN